MPRWPAPALLALLLTAACATPPPPTLPADAKRPAGSIDGMRLAAAAGPAAPKVPKATGHTPAPVDTPMPHLDSRDEAKRFAGERLAGLNAMATALDHPFADTWLRSESETQLARASTAVSAIRRGSGWRERFAEAWTELDRLERTLTDGARHDGLMVTQGEVGSVASDVAGSTP